ncbi:unnamed protein product [Rotaria magnacalcarata]|uniref:Uncharacterized protein n=1 Tax=Rotaria magnacalcarata TaxID=392030 RepID=A0A820CS89_9BILA|nr:unnamed protein product [Rotaria magnacalcarata]CAF4225595.1 unnamed protein product [Rotaria magnacalcarata]
MSVHDHVIIIGGSIGGMMTAACLSKYFKRITIIESDDVLNETLHKSTPDQIFDYHCRLANTTSIGRSGVGQIYQIHVLHSEGFNILHDLFPSLKDKLLNEYNIRLYSLKNDGKFVINGNLLKQNLIKDIEWLGIDRFTLEIAMRNELCLQFGNQIEWICNARVVELIADQSAYVAHGAKYRLKDSSSSSLDIYGDFIIDCTGHNTSSTKWLKESLNLIVPIVQMHFGCVYVTFVDERFKTGDSSLDSKPVYFPNANVPDNNTGCYISQVRTIKSTDENSLGILSTIAVNCVNAEYSPNDSYENLLDWVKEHLDRDFYVILKSTKLCSPLVPHRQAIDDRKYVESLGGAMCAFNPQIGQVMTHACRHARELRKVFDEHQHPLKDISYIFNQRASKINEECWLASTTNDWKTPTLKVIKTDTNGNIQIYQQTGDMNSIQYPRPKIPFIIKFLQWHNYWFLRCTSKSEKLSAEFLLVVNQNCGLFILMKPITFFQVCKTTLIHYLRLSRY